MSDDSLDVQRRRAGDCPDCGQLLTERVRPLCDRGHYPSLLERALTVSRPQVIDAYGLQETTQAWWMSDPSGRVLVVTNGAGQAPYADGTTWIALESRQANGNVALLNSSVDSPEGFDLVTNIADDWFRGLT